jgi:hypothetical protein
MRIAMPATKLPSDWLSEPSPQLRAYGEKLYLEAWAAYSAAGMPFGETAEGMLVWFHFGIETGATRS